MDKVHTTVRLEPGLMAAVRNEQMRQRRSSLTEMIAILLEDGLRLNGVYPFNAAVKLIKMYKRRDEFHAWCKANDVPAYNAFDAWRNYGIAFETDGDAADLIATQVRALK